MHVLSLKVAPGDVLHKPSCWITKITAFVAAYLLCKSHKKNMLLNNVSLCASTKK